MVVLATPPAQANAFVSSTYDMAYRLKRLDSIGYDLEHRQDWHRQESAGNAPEGVPITRSARAIGSDGSLRDDALVAELACMLAQKWKLSDAAVTK